MRAPLFEEKEGENQLIELSTRGKHGYTHVDTVRLREGTEKEFGRYYFPG